MRACLVDRAEERGVFITLFCTSRGTGEKALLQRDGIDECKVRT